MKPSFRINVDQRSFSVGLLFGSVFAGIWLPAAYALGRYIGPQWGWPFLLIGAAGMIFASLRECWEDIFRNPEDAADLKAAREVREGLANGTETKRPLAEFRQEIGA